MVRKISLEPIYGNGWLSLPAGDLREVPSPFLIKLAIEGVRSGLVVSDYHEFVGCMASFSPRYSEPSDTVNIEISRTGMSFAVGYAKMITDR